ncbi:MAG: GAF domain-containing protein [Planctomycetes bacterium]|nr:GAF domain-containing protein [Planctomycetota bacterium]
MNTELDLAAKFEKLNTIGIALSSERDLSKLLRMIVREARSLTHCDAGSLYIVFGDQLRIEVSQSATLGESKLTPITFPIDQSRISGYVAATGQWLNIEDVYHIPEAAEYGFTKDYDRAMSYRTKSVLAVPMQDHEDNIIGVLQLINALDQAGEKVPENVIPFRREYVDLVLSLASQAAVAIQNARLILEIKTLFASFIQFCTAAIDARDPTNAGHSRRVRELAVRIAEAVNARTSPPFDRCKFSAEEIEALSYAAWLHDFGKIAVSEAILTKGNKLSDEKVETITLRFRLAKKSLKALAAAGTISPEQRTIAGRLDNDLKLVLDKVVPGPISEGEANRLRKIAALKLDGIDDMVTPLLTADELENLLIPRGSLTPEEYRQVQAHVEHTADFLRQIPFSGHLEDLANIAGSHHEMLDGSGYHRKLRGDDVVFQARILAVADIFDALTASDRPYKKAHSIDSALGILKEMAAEGRLDADIVDLFTEEIRTLEDE